MKKKKKSFGTNVLHFNEWSSSYLIHLKFSRVTGDPAAPKFCLNVGLISYEALQQRLQNLEEKTFSEQAWERRQPDIFPIFLHNYFRGFELWYEEII
jgi:hypothetical protein